MDILVTTHWLAGQLGNANVAILDASRHLPAANRDPQADFETGHIPGARFLDLASLNDTSSPVPAALPSAGQMAERLAELGVAPDAAIVLYDDSALKTSARAWFALTALGRSKVAILDGGLPKWRAEGRDLENGPASYEPVAVAPLDDATGVRSKADMLANCASHAEQIIDARGADRVFGAGIDPIHGGQNGRIPGSLNVPFGQVLAADGTFKSASELRDLFTKAGADLDAPIVTSCGSGVTASVILFALYLTGKRDLALYDGSWSEWEADPDTPKDQGPA